MHLNRHIAQYIMIKNNPGAVGEFHERVVINQRMLSPPPPLPTHAEIAAGLALLGTLPIGEEEPIPVPTTFSLEHMLPIKPNSLFGGRDAELRQLARNLVSDGCMAMIATGIGGVGKTQLAAEFAHRYGQYFAGGVFWLSCADPALIANRIAVYGGVGALELFRSDDQLTQDEQVQRVRQQWSSALPRLLIFDNCDDQQEKSSKSVLEQWMPGSGGCRVLVTSRRLTWSPTLRVQRQEIHMLQRSESIALLQSMYADLDHANANAIADELGDLPLALCLAGSYLGKYGGRSITPAAYLAKLCSADLLDSLQKRTSSHPSNIVGAFALSYNRLISSDPIDMLAIRLLAHAAHLAPGEPFPHTLLVETVAGDDGEAAPTGEDSVDALTRLLDLGLLEQGAGDTLRMHRLISAYVRQNVPNVRAVAAVETSLIWSTYQINIAGYPSAMQPILAHVHYLAKAAIKREDMRAATLLNNYGYYLDQVGEYESARLYLERALALAERVLGSTHPATAISLTNLGLLLKDQGDLAKALVYLERAMTIREQTFGPNHPDTAISLNNLASIFEAQGSYAAAQPLYERSLAIHEQMLGPTHLQTAISLNNLASICEAQGSYAVAQPLYERALAIAEQALEPTHPDTAVSLNNLASLLATLGDYAAARPLYERALTIREQALGPTHLQTAISLNNLAGLFKAQGNYAAAQPLYERTLAIAEQILGSHHPDMAIALDNLAGLFKAQGHYAVAQPLYERALAIVEQMLGPNHPQTATNLNNLASLLKAQGNYAAAQPLYERALAIAKQSLGPAHPQTATSLSNLAGLYHAQRNYDVAQRLYEQALMIREQTLGPNHPETAQSLNNLGGLAEAQGNYLVALSRSTA